MRPTSWSVFDMDTGDLLVDRVEAMDERDAIRAAEAACGFALPASAKAQELTDEIPESERWRWR